MKHFLLALALVPLFSFQKKPSPKKLALIVAVGNYPQPGRWKNLSSVNDLNYIKSALLRQGFTAGTIDTLKNQQATRKSILAALDRLAAKAGPGDIVYFHFSGHGQQIEDDNGDEADGYDEALIPYDAKGSYDPVSYRGENHLRDDELGKKLNAIRKKIGKEGSLLVLLDACHSGTATRGNEFGICRGEPIPFKSPDYVVNTSLKLSATNALQDGFADGEDSIGNMITISASSPNQVNYEIRDDKDNGVGSLSYIFAQTINNLPADTDYETLFAMIRAGIQSRIPTQLPMIEGDESQEVFGNKYIRKQEVVSIQQWLTDTTFYINAGLLTGIGPGTTFKILNAKDNSVAAEGRVLNAGNFQSVAHTMARLSKANAYKLQLDGLHLGSFGVSIFIKNATSEGCKAIAAQFTDYLGKYQAIRLSPNADMMLDIHSLSDGRTEVSLVEKNDSVYYKRIFDKAGKATDNDLSWFLEGIKRAGRVNFFRNMEDGGQLAQGLETRVKAASPLVNGEAILHPLDLYDLELVNNGTSALYYTLIDLMPDNEVKVLIPGDLDQPQDYVLRPGERKVIEGIQVDETTPEGKEFFKVVFSRTPLDLRGVFKRSKTRGNGSMQSFESTLDDMLSDSQEGSSTRSTLSTVKVEEIGILTTGFTIRKR